MIKVEDIKKVAPRVYSNRPLTMLEIKRDVEQAINAPKEEAVAYNLLPEILKEHTERNVCVAFEGHKAFYPDLFLYDEKIVIEIDGGYHRGKMNEDKHRDDVFNEYGYHTIRIENNDTKKKLNFWFCLLVGLRGMKSDKVSINKMITTLEKKISAERIIEEEKRTGFFEF